MGSHAEAGMNAFVDKYRRPYPRGPVLLRPHAVPRLHADHAGLVDCAAAPPHEIHRGSVKPFLLANAGHVRRWRASLGGCSSAGAPSCARKMRRARSPSATTSVSVLSALEPCRTFSLRFTTMQPMCTPSDASACTCATTSWIVISGCCTCACRPDSCCKCRSTSTATCGWPAD